MGRRWGIGEKLVLYILIGLLLTACNSKLPPEEHLGEIYSLALDQVLVHSENLIDNLQYIALDMSNLEELSTSDREEIIDFFQTKYDIEVMDATLEQLLEQGLYSSDTAALHGILLMLEEVEIMQNGNVQLIGSSYRSGHGGKGVEVTISYKDEAWRVIDHQAIWTS